MTTNQKNRNSKAQFKVRSKGIMQRVATLVVCLLVVFSLAMVSQGELLGHRLGGVAEKVQKTDSDTLRVMADGTCVVNTTELAADISGFAGKVPLEIYVKNNRIVNVKALDNAESKEFFGRASVLLDKWKGKTLDEARQMQVDAVSGATYSSNAIIGNMECGIDYASRKLAQSSGSSSVDRYGAFDASLKNMLGLVVVLMAAVLPLFVRKRWYLVCQQILNVGVLGLWCGAFLSYSSMIGYAAHGIVLTTSAIGLVMLFTAFVYPLFDKKHHYCTFVCPLGSLQQLAGRTVNYKFTMKRRTVQRLDIFRQVLWAFLVLLIWSGVWSGWVDYEPFSAFIFQSASWVAIAIATVFVALSFVVARPYCRFVCPTGTLFRLSQTSK